LMPAAGPAFYEQLADPMGAGPFIAVQQQLTQAGDAGTFLTSLYNQDYLIRSLGEPELVVGGGISAIPSVHNAMAVLFALASFRAHYLLGLAMSGFALLIWVGSVYLNWHYAVDGMIGAAGAAALWYGAGWLVDHVSERGGATEAAPKIVSTLKT
jgi:membrane-associated phospholipid phosphatase